MITFPEFQRFFPALCRNRVRVAVADDSRQGRGGLRTMLDNPPVMAVVAEAATAEELLGHCEREQPDVAVVDLCFPGELDGIDVCLSLKEHYPAVRRLIVTGHESARARDAARRSQAVQGYALKRYSDGLLWKCVLDVAAGRQAFPSYKGGWLAEELSDSARLQLIDAPGREVLGALAGLIGRTDLPDYGAIKTLVNAHPGHARLGDAAYVRRVLERVRERLGMRSVAAARWYARATMNETVRRGATD